MTAKYNFHDAADIMLCKTREDNFIPAVLNNAKVEARIKTDDSLLSLGPKESVDVLDEHYGVLETSKSSIDPEAQVSQTALVAVEEEVKNYLEYLFLEEANAKRQIPASFSLDKRPDFTKELYEDIVKQYVKDDEIDLYTPRIEGINDVIYEIESGLGKYITLKIGEEERVALQNQPYDDHETTDEEKEIYKYKQEHPS